MFSLFNENSDSFIFYNSKCYRLHCNGYFNIKIDLYLFTTRRHIWSQKEDRL